MKKLLNTTKLLFVAIFFFSLGAQSAIASVEERIKAEIATFKEDIQTESSVKLITTADLITGSGLSDEALYKVVEARTKQAYEAHMANPKDKQLARDLNALVRAYASFGKSDSRDFIVNLVSTSKSRGVRNRAHRLHPKLYWFKKRNELMQDTTYYKEDQDLMTHRFMGLVKSEDPTLRRWAAEEIVRRGGTEEMVYTAMDEILKAEAGDIKSDMHLDSLAWFCKILARYDLENHKETLLSIQNDPKSHKKLKKYASF